ncbi:hypothetical protein SLS62_004438 [Diatrype stigma]|uniref:Uncharacterized protein n=1 Tax=Diatrype stigma TaxID=117547 RepID=A0AAN9UWK4_9PEZI
MQVAALTTLCNNKFLHFNSTCAFQVHVGRGTQGFQLPTLQKLTSLLFVGGEKLLDEVHPRHRLGAPFCHPITTKTFLGNFVLAGREPTATLDEEWFNRCVAPSQTLRVEAQLRRIWQAKTVDEFCRMLDPREGNVAYSFAGLSPRERENATDIPNSSGVGEEPKVAKPTIEFRQGDGNVVLDEKYPVAWIKTATSLVAWAIDVDEASFEEVIQETARNVPPSGAQEKLSTFLKHVGVSDEAVVPMVNRAASLNGA